jgi:glycosyltransferase involved in cell wall biosynthesis
MRVGIPCTGFIGWAGGLDFLRLIVESLLAADEPDLELHLLLQDQGPMHSARSTLRSTKQAAISLIKRGSTASDTKYVPNLIHEILRWEDKHVALHHIDIGESALARACQTHKIDVLIPSISPLSASFPTPWVGYLYDFQHKHLPHYFSARERASRERSFGTMMRLASCVIVNSRNVAADVAQFIPDARARCFCLPFSAALKEEWLFPRKDSLVHYDVQEPFFMISNQFWIHKRHDTAFQALKIFSQTHSAGQLVCTGGLIDNRFPDYFSELLSYVKNNGLADRVRILGLIPKADQIDLMKRSIAVIQPTSFEGGPGGGSVYDAVALGVPTIVSDIAVNREIEEFVTAYFPLGDARALSDLMGWLISISPRRASIDELRWAGRQRRRACGRALLDAARFAVRAASS